MIILHANIVVFPDSLNVFGNDRRNHSAKK
jgi:hypothetical protein